MKYKDLIIKFIVSIICIIVMSVIIFFVYNYYSDKALKGNNTSANNQSLDSNDINGSNDNNIDNNSNKKNELTFKTFNNVKTYFDEFDTKVIMTYQETDAGNILLINDNVIVSYSINDTITYGVLDDAIVIRVNNPYSGDTLVFADSNGNVFKEYSLINNNTYNLYIKKSIMSNRNDSIEFNGNTFYITWRVLQDDKNIILNNEEILKVDSNIFIDSIYRKGDVVEYTTEIEYLGNKKFTEAVKVEEFNLEDYVKKFS